MPIWTSKPYGRTSFRALGTRLRENSGRNGHAYQGLFGEWSRSSSQCVHTLRRRTLLKLFLRCRTNDGLVGGSAFLTTFQTLDGILKVTCGTQGVLPIHAADQGPSARTRSSRNTGGNHQLFRRFCSSPCCSLGSPLGKLRRIESDTGSNKCRQYVQNLQGWVPQLAVLFEHLSRLSPFCSF